MGLPGLLSTSEIESMRVQIERTFTIDAKKLTKSNSSDGRGGRTVVWVEGTAFKCRFSTNPSDYTQSVNLGSVISDSEFSLIYPYNLSIAAKDRVRIDGSDYEVTSVWENSSINLHGRASLIKLV